MKIFSILAAGMMLFASSLSAQSQSHPANAIARGDDSRFGWADVLRVDPVYDEAPVTQSTTQPCYEEQVPLHTTPVDDSGKRATGGVLGAIIGGILGHQIGKGDGRKIATAGGVVAGAVVGSNVAADNGRDGEREDAPKYTIERRCPGADAGTRHIAAYDVEYRYRGDVYTSRLSYDPGDRIRVKVSVTPAD